MITPFRILHLCLCFCELFLVFRFLNIQHYISKTLKSMNIRCKCQVGFGKRGEKEYRTQNTGHRRRRAEDRRQKAEDKGQKIRISNPSSPRLRRTSIEQGMVKCKVVFRLRCAEINPPSARQVPATAKRRKISEKIITKCDLAGCIGFLIDMD